MQVAEIMSKNVRLTSPSDTIEQAAKLMKQMDCGALPVGENDRLVGVVTDRDIALRAVAKGKSPKQCKVKEVMSKGIKYVYEDEPTEAVAESMKKLQLRRLPVLNRDKRLVGIVALGDLATRHDGSLAGEALHGVSEKNALHHEQPV